MSKTNIKLISRQISYAFVAAVMVLSYFPNVASAASITSRSVVLGSSLADATTTYAFTFTVPTTGTAIKSVGFRACTTASGDCSTPISGFDSSSSTLTSQPSNLDGAGVNTGWTVSTATAGELRLSKTGATVTPQPAITVGFSGVKNPTAVGTFYMRITTYSVDDWTGALDTGTIAASTAAQVTVTASVDETLTFTIGSASVALGTLATGSTKFGTSTMTVATNAASGYTVKYVGTTLTSGLNTIDAMAGGVSVSDSKQFGINLVENTDPIVGAAKTGTGTGAAETGYGTIDSFKFVPSGETIASAAVATNSNVFTASYIANIDGATAAGAYTASVTYTATANF